MRIRLDQVRHEPVSWRETLEISPAVLERSELVALGPLSCRGQVSYAAPGYILRLDLQYERTLTCFRCLSPAREPVSSELEVVVMVSEPQEEGDPSSEVPDRELEEEDLNLVFVSQEVLDTQPMVVEQLQLELPMKSLCRQDCKGLCVHCGADLNLGPCPCRNEAYDPRWAALEVLRPKPPSGEGRR